MSLPGTDFLGEIRIELGPPQRVTRHPCPVANSATDVTENLLTGELVLPSSISEALVGGNVGIP